ncbi:MAG: enoyl-CoA hydratase/isomerase family protein, partial [Candidatus Lokiarchaeota archaeon]|nr:enoyl-CoA hydratase/isomerase family protein [Candidatus Lokiarchaeota archaeon]
SIEFGEFIEFSIKKKFGIIKLNRVHRGNAITPEMAKNLKNAIEFCQNSEKIRGIILTGNGTSFTTGMDIDDIDGSDHVAVKEYEKTAASIQDLLYYGKPTICAINGKSMGDGVAYALCSDYRIAIRETFFIMPEINLGVFPGTGIIVLMSRIIGIPWTKKILMFAEKVSTEKALEIGLIDQIVENQEELMKIALDKAKFLFTKNQTVLNAIKLCSNHLADKSYNEAFELEKIGSGWFEYEDKEKYIIEFRKKFY